MGSAFDCDFGVTSFGRAPQHRDAVDSAVHPSLFSSAGSIVSRSMWSPNGIVLTCP